MSDANKSKQEQMVKAEEDNTETKLSTVNENIVEILDLLNNVVTGTASFKVSVENYGLSTSFTPTGDTGSIA
jgi:hypothetical protein